MAEMSPWAWATVHLYGLTGMAIILIAMLFGSLYVIRHFADGERNPTSHAPPAALEFYLPDETIVPPNETDGAPNEDHPLPNRARLGRCSDEELQEVADDISDVWCTRFTEEQERILREELEAQREEEERELEEREREREREQEQEERRGLHRT